MKNRSRKIAAVLLAACLTAQPLVSFAQEAPVLKPDRRNAAWYYTQAFGLLKYPDSKDLNSRISRVIQKGWPDQDKELELVLKDNEPAFREFKKARRLKKCDFDFGRKYKYLIQKEIPTYSKIRSLYRLNLLRARHYESEGDDDKALDIYLSNLTFAGHLAQDNIMMMRMISLVIEKETCAAFEDFLNASKLSKKKYLKIYEFLAEEERARFQPGELIEMEKSAFLSLIAMLVDTYIADSDSQGSARVSDEERARVLALGGEVKKQAEQLADMYYGNFTKAIRTNDPQDWDFAVERLNSLIKEAQPKVEDLSGFVKAVFSDSTKDTSGAVDKKLANKVVLTMLSLTIPNFRGIGEGYYSALSQLKELKSLVLIKAAK
ncbi:MAG: hypothetical protein PHJ00_02065 [Candidatus Omnitrophica bacterium]|nr:hypothetical protein [Candidatus Omnitrophota bacterium]